MLSNCEQWSSSSSRLCAADSRPVVLTAEQTDLRAFVGTWKENPAKSRYAISGVLTYTFTDEQDGFVSIVRANTPLHDRVRFDGKDYASSGSPGLTVSWTKISDTQFASTGKRDGVLIGTARWTLSEGGSHLTQETTPVRANGDNDINTIEYVRISGVGNTLFGVWKPISSRSTVPDLFTITLVGDELSVFYPKYGFIVYTMRLDGKRYPGTSPRAAAGSSSAAFSVGPRTVRRVTYLGKKATLEVIMSVSEDGATMTVTTRNPNGLSSHEPSVGVLEKQR
jgi:hypothetical protein